MTSAYRVTRRWVSVSHTARASSSVGAPPVHTTGASAATAGGRAASHRPPASAEKIPIETDMNSACTRMAPTSPSKLGSP